MGKKRTNLINGVKRRNEEKDEEEKGLGFY